MKKILNKILEEINKDTPRLDYIRGLIEASVEEETSAVKVSNISYVLPEVKDVNVVHTGDPELPPVPNFGKVLKNTLQVE